MKRNAAHLLLVLLFTLPFVGDAQAQKNKRKDAPEKGVRSALIRNAEVAMTTGDLDSADVLLARALWMWPDRSTNQLRAQVLLQKGDTAGYCGQAAKYTDEDAERKRFYAAHCTRRDSMDFASSGLSLEQYPGFAQVARTWSRANGSWSYRLFDQHDSLKLAFTATDVDTVYTQTDSFAEFPGGENELFAYLGRSVRYPMAAADAGISGTAYLSFVIERDGRVNEVKVIRGVHHTIDNESLRVVQGMPVWQPATYRGKTVRSRFNLPVRFTIR